LSIGSVSKHDFDDLVDVIYVFIQFKLVVFAVHLLNILDDRLGLFLRPLGLCCLKSNVVINKVCTCIAATLYSADFVFLIRFRFFILLLLSHIHGILSKFKFYFICCQFLSQFLNLSLQDFILQTHQIVLFCFGYLLYFHLRKGIL